MPITGSGSGSGGGSPGADGRGIVSVTRTSGTGAAGTTDTYTITYSDSTTSTFTVHNGADATGGGGSGAVEVFDDSTDQGAATSLNLGTGLSATVSGGVAQIDVVPNAGTGQVQDIYGIPDWVIASSIRTAVQADVGQTTVGRFWRGDRARIPFSMGSLPRGGRRLSTPVSLSDYTKTGTSAALGESTTQPVVFDRAVTLVNGGAATGTIRPTVAQSTPFDLTTGFIRLALRASAPWGGSGPGPILLQVASDNFVSGNYHQVQATRTSEGLLAPDRWGILSYNFNEFAPVGLGADLTSINQWRIQVSGAYTLALGPVEFCPAVMPRALCVIGVDDATVEMYQAMVRTMATYGLPPTLYVNVGGLDLSATGTALKYEHLRVAHDMLGAQIATHAFNADHNEAHFGDDLLGYHMRAMALRKALGLYGVEDASYYGGPNIGMHFITDDHYKLVRKLYATCRGNFNSLATVETLPLGDPWNTRSYLLGSGDTFDPGSTLRGYIDKGIAAKGFLEVSSHNSNWTTYGSVTTAMCQYLAQKQAEGVVDVVTKAEAMRRLALIPG